MHENGQFGKILPEKFELKKMIVKSERKAHKSRGGARWDTDEDCFHELKHGNAKIEGVKGKFRDVGS